MLPLGLAPSWIWWIVFARAPEMESGEMVPVGLVMLDSPFGQPCGELTWVDQMPHWVGHSEAPDADGAMHCQPAPFKPLRWVPKVGSQWGLVDSNHHLEQTDRWNPQTAVAIREFGSLGPHPPSFQLWQTSHQTQHGREW